eukprot:2741332-Pyramimonas_sp.AAC.1
MAMEEQRLRGRTAGLRDRPVSGAVSRTLRRTLRHVPLQPLAGTPRSSRRTLRQRGPCWPAWPRRMATIDRAGLTTASSSL